MHSFQDRRDLFMLDADGKGPVQKIILGMFENRGFIYCLICIRRQKDLAHRTQLKWFTLGEGRIALSICQLETRRQPTPRFSAFPKSNKTIPMQSLRSLSISANFLMYDF